MKNLRIISVLKDPGSLTPTGDFRLRIKFEITGTDGSDDSKVLFVGQYRLPGSSPESIGSPICSDKMHIPAEGSHPEDSDHSVVIPIDSSYIPHGAEVTIWGMIDTDFKTYCKL